MAVYQWVLAHEAVVSGAAVAVLDLLFALSPSFASNGVLHWVYLQLGKLAGK